MRNFNLIVRNFVISAKLAFYGFDRTLMIFGPLWLNIFDELRCCCGVPASIGQRVAAAGVAVYFIYNKEVVVAHWQHALTFVGHSSRRVQRAVLISFACRLCWHAAGLSFAVFKLQSAALFRRTMAMITFLDSTALRRPDDGRYMCGVRG